MRTLTYQLRDLKKVNIEIGFEGENNRTQVRIDCGEVFAEYPNAEVALKVQAPKGGIYPATVTRDGDMILWTVRDCDVANKGNGEFQLTFTDGETVVKSCRGKIHIDKSLKGSGTAPSGVQDWLDRAEEVLEGVEAAEIHQPMIGLDGYWYKWDQEEQQYVSTGTKAQGQDGQPGTDATPDLITKPYSQLIFPVAKGTQCYHDGKLYEANQAIQTSEQWTAAHWTETNVEEQLTHVKSELRAVAVTPEMFGAKGDGVTDDTEAIQTAVNSGNEVRFADNKTYFLTQQVNIDHDVKLIGGKNTVIKTESVVNEGVVSLNKAFSCSGVLKKTVYMTTDYTTTGNTDNSGNKFTFDDMDGIEVGDILEIVATDQFYSYARQYYYLGAVLLVGNVYNDHIYTTCDMPFDIENTANVSVKVYKAPRILIDGLNFVSDRALIGFTYAVDIVRCRESIVRNCSFDMMWNALHVSHSVNSKIEALIMSNGKYDNSLERPSYGISIESCTGTVIERVYSIFGQGCVDMTGTFPNINTFIRFCNLNSECRQLGLDIHENAYNTVIEDCDLAGLALFGTAFVNRCRIHRNNRVGTASNDFNIMIRGSHNPAYAIFRIRDCEFYGGSGSITIDSSTPETPIQSFKNIIGEVTIENINGGKMRIKPSTSATIIDNIIKRLIIKNWKNATEIIRETAHTIEFMEVIDCEFSNKLWMNDNHDALSFGGIKYLHLFSELPKADRIYIDSPDNIGVLNFKKGAKVSLSSNDVSAHYVICGRNLESNDPSDYLVGGVSGNAGDSLTRTINNGFLSSLSADNGELVFTQPNNTTTVYIYPKCFFYVDEVCAVKMSVKVKDVGSVSGSKFALYVAVVDAVTGLVIDRYGSSSVEVTQQGALITEGVFVKQPSYILTYIRSSAPKANAVTKLSELVATIEPADIEKDCVYEEYHGSRRDGDGILLTEEGINRIGCSVFSFNKTVKASLI